MGFNPIKEVKKIGRGGRANPFNELNKIKRQVQKIAELEKQISNFPKELQKVAKQVEALPKEIKKLENEISKLPKRFEELPKTIQNELEKILKGVIAIAMSKALEEVYKELKENIDILDGISINVDFSVFTSALGGGFNLRWSGFSQRVQWAEQLVKNMEKFRGKQLKTKKQILDFIKALAPNGVSVSVSFVTVDINAYKGIERVGHYLEKIGVK